MGYEQSYGAQIEAHYAASWGPVVARRRLEAGPVHELPPDFEILVFARKADSFVFATKCMSQPSDDHALELHLFAREGMEDAAVEILTAVAHYHRTGHRLGLWHTVNFGKALVTGSDCSFGFVSLPYLDGPKLEWSSAPKVQFLWLIPVTESEVRFKKANGVEALERLFEERRFNYLDPHRASVA